MSLHKQGKRPRARGEGVRTAKLFLAEIFGCMQCQYGRETDAGGTVLQAMFANFGVGCAHAHSPVKAQLLKVHTRQRVRKFITNQLCAHLSNPCKQTSPAPSKLRAASCKTMDVRLLLRFLLCLVSTAAAFGQTGKNTLQFLFHQAKNQEYNYLTEALHKSTKFNIMKSCHLSITPQSNELFYCTFIHNNNNQIQSVLPGATSSAC